MEDNFGKPSSKNKIKQGEQKLFKKYGEKSKNYLRENVFQNPCVIKLEKCKYLDPKNLVLPQKLNTEKIVAIFDRAEMELIEKALRPYYKKK